MKPIENNIEQELGKFFDPYEGLSLEEIDAIPMAKVSDCQYCENRLPGHNVCAAFILGIPREYLSGESKHREPDGRELDSIVYEFDYDLMEL